jgi:glycosidase
MKDPAVLKEALGEYQKKSRDNARTPMQWDASPHAGFTSEKAKPWMRAMDNYTEVNAETQINDPESPFAYWKSMLSMRKKYMDIVVYGNFEMLDPTNEKVIAYKRESEAGEKILVVCNFSPDKVEWKSEQISVKEIVMSSYGRSLKEIGSESISLDAYEAVALLL